MSWSNLRQLMVQKFNQSEFETLCFDLQVSYDALQGKTYADKIQTLLLLYQRNDQTSQLLDYLRPIRPQVEWELIELEEETLPDSQDSGSDSNKFNLYITGNAQGVVQGDNVEVTMNFNKNES